MPSSLVKCFPQTFLELWKNVCENDMSDQDAIARCKMATGKTIACESPSLWLLVLFPNRFATFADKTGDAGYVRISSETCCPISRLVINKFLITITKSVT